MRKSVYDKLCIAQKNLPYGLKFKVYEGHRSKEVQKILFEQRFNRVGIEFPHFTYEEKFNETIRLVSPIVNLDGSINVLPHNTGGAIDIEVITESGELLDMGMTAADWVCATPEFCMTYSKRVSVTAQNNRAMLLNVLQQQGFVNYPGEWWHFSYGDKYWAYHQPVQTAAIYGPID